MSSNIIPPLSCNKKVTLQECTETDNCHYFRKLISRLYTYGHFDWQRAYS